MIRSVKSDAVTLKLQTKFFDDRGQAARDQALHQEVRRI